MALVGLSLGGAGALLHGAPLKDQVSAIVAFYPALTRLASDMRPLAASVNFPVLVLAGEKDMNNGCCMIESAKALDAAPKTVHRALSCIRTPATGSTCTMIRDSSTEKRMPPTLGQRGRLAFLKRFHPPRSD